MEKIPSLFQETPKEKADVFVGSLKPGPPNCIPSEEEEKRISEFQHLSYIRFHRNENFCHDLVLNCLSMRKKSERKKEKRQREEDAQSIQQKLDELMKENHKLRKRTKSLEHQSTPTNQLMYTELLSKLKSVASVDEIDKIASDYDQIMLKQKQQQLQRRNRNITKL